MHHLERDVAGPDQAIRSMHDHERWERYSMPAFTLIVQPVDHQPHATDRRAAIPWCRSDRDNRTRIFHRSPTNPCTPARCRPGARPRAHSRAFVAAADHDQWISQASSLPGFNVPQHARVLHFLVLGASVKGCNGGQRSRLRIDTVKHQDESGHRSRWKA